jgi:hypothetical protein
LIPQTVPFAFETVKQRRPNGRSPVRLGPALGRASDAARWTADVKRGVG